MLESELFQVEVFFRVFACVHDLSVFFHDFSHDRVLLRAELHGELCRGDFEYALGLPPQRLQVYGASSIGVRKIGSKRITGLVLGLELRGQLLATKVRHQLQVNHVAWGHHGVHCLSRPCQPLPFLSSLGR